MRLPTMVCLEPTPLPIIRLASPGDTPSRRALTYSARNIDTLSFKGSEPVGLVWLVTFRQNLPDGQFTQIVHLPTVLLNNGQDSCRSLINNTFPADPTVFRKRLFFRVDRGIRARAPAVFICRKYVVNVYMVHIVKAGDPLSMRLFDRRHLACSTFRAGFRCRPVGDSDPSQAIDGCAEKCNQANPVCTRVRQYGVAEPLMAGTRGINVEHHGALEARKK